MAKKAVKKAAPKKEKSKSQEIRDYAAANPGKTTKEIADATGSSYTLVYQAVNKGKKKAKKKPGRKPGRKPMVAGKISANGDGGESAKAFGAAIHLLKVAGSVEKAEEAWKIVRKVADAILLPF